jgi:hypothetical protein
MTNPVVGRGMGLATAWLQPLLINDFGANPLNRWQASRHSNEMGLE